MKSFSFSSGRIVVIALCLVLPLSACKDKKIAKPDYLSIVKRYADTLLEHGRDHYGSKSSPLFTSALDMKTLRLPAGDKLKGLQNLDRKAWGIRRNDRTLTGANVMHQENLFQVLYALTEVTGEEKYANEANESLQYFFRTCQSPVTGLMVWGEHMGWDFRTDTVMQHYNEIEHSVGEGMTHEFYRPWVLWEKSFQLDPIACEKFALGIWNHQIYDQETGDFSRHAKWDRHGPGKNSQFPRHGGFYIATWASAYEQTGTAVFLKAIETLLNFFERNRSERSGAIPAEVGHPRSGGTMMWPHSNISLAIDLWNGSAKVPGSLAKKMRECALRSDKTFLRVPHDLGPNGNGFIKLANTHTLQPKRHPSRADVPSFTHLWGTGYGRPTDAKIANLCYLRYKQTNNQGYKDLICMAAERYLSSNPTTGIPIFPGTFGDVIYLMLEAYEITGDDNFLDRADYFADLAVSTFFRNGSALPSASSIHGHYEAITGEDTLMMALLKLFLVKNKRDDGVSLIWCDR